MNLPDFVFIQSEDLPGGELILQTKGEYYIFRAFKFLDRFSMENFLKNHNLLNDCIKIPGFRILICYIGNISHISEKVLLGQSVPMGAKRFFAQLTHFYETERTHQFEGRLKKFKD